MKKALFLLLFIVKITAHSTAQTAPITLVIHGGAGNIAKDNMTPEQEKAYHHVLKQSLQAGYAVLQNGGSSIDAVRKAIHVLEDSPLFNAGKGAVLTNDRRIELDASIIDGKTQQAGAVAGVTTIKNPIEAAYAVMTKSPHVLMAGAGAEKFAKEQGITLVNPSYFYTKERKEALERALQKEAIELDHSTKSKIKKSPKSSYESSLTFTDEGEKFGTVGCVALDQYGNLAAGTSTGGMNNKRYGRIGDAPIIGAGTYANNATCAISATGHGEYFIRSVVAYDISALIEYKGLSLEEAANKVVLEKLVEKGGSGGVISLDTQGNIAMPFNTAGMFRGFVTSDGTMQTAIFK